MASPELSAALALALALALASLSLSEARTVTMGLPLVRWFNAAARALGAVKAGVVGGCAAVVVLDVGVLLNVAVAVAAVVAAVALVVALLLAAVLGLFAAPAALRFARAFGVRLGRGFEVAAGVVAALGTGPCHTAMHCGRVLLRGVSALRIHCLVSPVLWHANSGLGRCCAVWGPDAAAASPVALARAPAAAM